MSSEYDCRATAVESLRDGYKAKRFFFHLLYGVNTPFFFLLFLYFRRFFFFFYTVLSIDFYLLLSISLYSLLFMRLYLSLSPSLSVFLYLHFNVFLFIPLLFLPQPSNALRFLQQLLLIILHAMIFPLESSLPSPASIYPRTVYSNLAIVLNPLSPFFVPSFLQVFLLPATL
ncbi:unnamed protein product [Acanthosepion pharaonis]|uniref:Uncharacterized protein n=1 Tax=Acanthosepion pharaonis TaxID=158019 RepID=A0A812CRV9_ACAPH|nr:unnamed protein product [Sepia pharaonis]